MADNMKDEKAIEDLPISEKPCKRVRRARATIDKSLERAHYKEMDAKECHEHGLFRASPSLNIEARRLEHEGNEIMLKKKQRDDRGRKYALLCQKKQQKQLPLEE